MFDHFRSHAFGAKLNGLQEEWLYFHQFVIQSFFAIFLDYWLRKIPLCPQSVQTENSYDHPS